MAGELCHDYHVVHPFGIRRMAAGASFYPDVLARLRGLPQPTTQTPTVVIIELGGGHSLTDLQTFCNYRSIPVPEVKVVGNNNYTGDPNGADGECALDLQIVAGATFGMARIIMKYVGNTDAEFIAAVQWCATNQASENIVAVSISWGASESNWTASSRLLFNNALLACDSRGISVFAASGDNGSSDGGMGDNVDFPASGMLTGVGGTTAQRVGEQLSDVCWSDSGGGFSKYALRPNWQPESVGVARMVPDVAEVADPASGYNIWMKGSWRVIGGTSGAAPMWAAAVACMCWASNKNVGYGLLARQLFSLPAGTLKDVMNGGNGKFKAGVGPDPCTGLGCYTPKVLAALGGPVTPVPVPPVPVPPVPLPPIPPPVVTPTAHIRLLDTHPAGSFYTLGVADSKVRRIQLDRTVASGTYGILSNAQAQFDSDFEGVGGVREKEVIRTLINELVKQL